MEERKKRPKYTEGFKADAVKLVIEQGYSHTEVSRRLGIPKSNISRWVGEFSEEKQYRSENGVSRRELEAENRRLMKENKRLQMEREILKKATAFFAKESG